MNHHIKPKLPPYLEPLAYGVPDACRVIGIKKTKLYELLKSKQIEARRVGRRTLITASSLRRFIEGEG